MQVRRALFHGRNETRALRKEWHKVIPILRKSTESQLFVHLFPAYFLSCIGGTDQQIKSESELMQ